MRIKLGLVSEARLGFLNQVKLCLFSLRKNGGLLSNIPVTIITNSVMLDKQDQAFLQENFSPIEFKTSPRLGAIPHTSKLNVFYSIEPSTYDILMFMDCDTVVRQPLDHIIDPIQIDDAEFLCRRGGETDRNRFVDFDGLVQRFCARDRKRKVIFENQEEWPMFNSGVFLATSAAVQKVRKNSVEITYQLFNEWQKTSVLMNLPPTIKRAIKLLYKPKNPFKQNVTQNWTIEQGSLALSCIKAGIKVQYLDEKYNNWGGDDDLHILHCFKSVYQFNRRTMFTDDSDKWIGEYLESDVPGKQFLAEILNEYKQKYSN